MNEILSEFQSLLNSAIKAYNEKNYRTSSVLFSACSDIFRRASEKANSEYVPPVETVEEVKTTETTEPEEVCEEVKDENVNEPEKQD